MKIGILSAYVIYLIISLLVNLFAAYLVLSKKMSQNSQFYLGLRTVEGLVSIFFTIAIIRLVIKSGWKA